MAQLKDTHVDGVLSVGACEDVEAELSKLNGELEDTGWINLLSDDDVIVRYRIKNGFITVSGQNSGNNSYRIPDGDYKKITTIPTPYRPSFETPFSFHCYGGGATSLSAFVGIDGIIQLYQKNSDGRYWGFTFSYPIQ